MFPRWRPDTRRRQESLRARIALLGLALLLIYKKVYVDARDFRFQSIRLLPYDTTGTAVFLWIDFSLSRLERTVAIDPRATRAVHALSETRGKSIVCHVADLNLADRRRQTLSTCSFSCLPKQLPKLSLCAPDCPPLVCSLRAERLGFPFYIHQSLVVV